MLTSKTMSVQYPGLIAEGPHLAEPVLPPAHEFVTSAGFGGAAALLAAIVVAAVTLWAARRGTERHRLLLEQRERQHQEVRADEQRTVAIAQCWERLVWVVKTAGIEPAASEGTTLGLGPEVALELLRGLQRDAEQLGDDTLAKAVTVYLSQFSLVLVQQGGLLSELARRASPSAADADFEEQPPKLVDTPAAARGSQKAPADASGKSPDGTPRNGPAKAPGRGPEKAPAKSVEKAPEKASEKAPERPKDRPQPRPQQKPGETSPTDKEATAEVRGPRQ